MRPGISIVGNLGGLLDKLVEREYSGFYVSITFEIESMADCGQNLRMRILPRPWLRSEAMEIGGWEGIIVLVVVLLVFGVGRVEKLGSELGKGIRAFREGLHEGQNEPVGSEEPGEDKDRIEEQARQSEDGS